MRCTCGSSLTASLVSFSDNGGLAQIALLLQSLVARPAIGVKRDAGLDRVRDERM